MIAFTIDLFTCTECPIPTNAHVIFKLKNIINYYELVKLIKIGL
jgi:hypothetical protein